MYTSLPPHAPFIIRNAVTTWGLGILDPVCNPRPTGINEYNQQCLSRIGQILFEHSCSLYIVYKLGELFAHNRYP